jgi:AmmeMemoRadiSam system protein A
LPVKELYKDVIENAINAAFYDPRFAKLTKKEFKTIKIEISVLGIPTKLNYSSEKELLDKLNKNKPGIIIKKGYHQATFLPQVWEELATAELFLSELCLKAGLNSKEWKDNIDIEIYDVEKFKEE